MPILRERSRHRDRNWRNGIAGRKIMDKILNLVNMYIENLTEEIKESQSKIAKEEGRLQEKRMCLSRMESIKSDIEEEMEKE